MMRKSFSCAALLLGILCTPELSAQGIGTSPTRIGVMGGINFATFGGEDTDDDLKSKIGLLAGVSWVKARPGAIGFEVDALYSMKGAKSTGSGDAEISFNLNYIELPLLLRFDVPTTGGIRPHLVVGTSLALRTGCSAEGKDEGITVSLDCDELETVFNGKFKSFDAGLTGGGGLDFPLGTKTLTIGARYTYGLLSIVDVNDLDTKNKAFSFFAGLSMPLGR